MFCNVLKYNELQDSVVIVQLLVITTDPEMTGHYTDSFKKKEQVPFMVPALQDYLLTSRCTIKKYNTQFQ